jgi:hypothetical protein
LDKRRHKGIFVERLLEIISDERKPLYPISPTRDGRINALFAEPSKEDFLSLLQSKVGH